MLNLSKKLASLRAPIQVGVVGAGVFGSQLIYQIENVDGMTTAAVADIEEGKAKRTLRAANVSPDEIDRVGTVSAANAALERTRRAVTTDASVLIACDVDVVVEATGVADIAARHAYLALMESKHVVMVSVEADTAVGPHLSRLAENNDVSYTMAYGDQPAQIVGLCDWAKSIGLDIVAAGRWANEPDPYGTPDDVFERFGADESFIENYNPSPRIYNTFLDGTKIAVESCAAANALGLPPDTPGMHMPKVPIAEIPQRLRPEADGGLLQRTGIVDAVRSDERFSVFAVTATENEFLQEYFGQRDEVPTANDGKYQVFHRPYHIAPETTVSIASAALENEPTGTPRSHEAEVVGAAKRDLGPGDTIDGGGGDTVYGRVEEAGTASEHDHIPLELLRGAEVVRAVETDEVVTYDDVEVDSSSFIYHLRKLSEAIY